jgi:DNA-binding transcriptional LysR family regulator
VACLPRDHRFADRDDVDITELLDDPIVCAPASAGGWRDYWMATELRSRPPTIAAVAATYEAETTAISRGLGISFTTEAIARLYDRPGIVYVPIRGHAPSYIALAWNPSTLSDQARTLVDHVAAEWNFPEGQGVERPADFH